MPTGRKWQNVQNSYLCSVYKYMQHVFIKENPKGFVFLRIYLCVGEKERESVCVLITFFLWHVEHRENKVRYAVHAPTHAPCKH